MPIGAFKLNSIARYFSTAVPNIRVIPSQYTKVDTTSGVVATTASSKIGSYALRVNPTDGSNGSEGFTITTATTSAGQTYFNPSTIMCYEFWFKATMDSNSRKHIFWSTTNQITNDGDPVDKTEMILYQDSGQFRLTTFATFNYVTLGTRDSNWHHLAVQSNGDGYITVWYDGVQKLNVNRSSWSDRNIFYHCYGIFQNWTPVSSNYVDFDEIVITHGVQKYTPGSDFTPYTTAQTNSANTIGIFHCESDPQYDDDGGTRYQKFITAEGNAQISTAQSKFGSASALFDGSSDYLNVTTTASETSGAITLEAWVRFDILPSSQTLGGGSYMMLATISSSSYVLIQNSKVQVAVAGAYYGFTIPTVSTNTWYHIAVVRESNNDWFVYWNGTKYTGVVDAGDTDVNKGGNWFGTTLTIGKFIDSRGSWDGYIDEFRVSNSARYTATFTPSTTAFTNDSNTLLLIHCDGTNTSTTFIDDNGV